MIANKLLIRKIEMKGMLAIICNCMVYNNENTPYNTGKA